MIKKELHDVIRSVRPALIAADVTEGERAQFLYDLVREVHTHVKFDVYGPDIDAPERARIGAVADAALPPTP
ncbi:hypothetical protein ALI44B_00185 [Leifsonia sp. ALI-44-B]|uniref:hypothetical protein n=1 Tax=Leifsonia sp. ALI-44-B TaxID=1933776 RepID=UPI00097BB2CF|nr:hypothetical protein [Leifsonia sp. ALI-44-B]ONI65411.1 hypothetical protein ALI44B_00185 [Leifsonia sp. ALI-44-B]